MDWKTAVIDSLVTNALQAEGCWLVATIFKYYLPRKQRYGYMLVISVVMASVIVGLSQWFLTWLWQSRPEYTAFASASWPIRLVVCFLLVGCMTILSVLWYAMEEEQENLRRKNEAEKLARDAELYQLRHQLQPHFLFNSLNSISALVGSDPEQARKMVLQLSDFLRSTLKKEEQQWVSLEEELRNLELYLDIEKLRFGHRLFTFLDSAEKSRSMKLPSLLLQPIVENAIKFGLYHTTGEVLIRIEAQAQGNDLLIRVQNPFDDDTSQPGKGAGFGLSSVKRRLYLLFARTDLLEAGSEGQLFITQVRIPQQPVGSKN
jgi:two-component system LytT family sensor kinase